MRFSFMASAVAFGLCVVLLSSDALAQRGGAGRRGAAAEDEPGQTPARGRGGFGQGRGGGRIGAQGGPGAGVNPLFVALDADGDGEITLAEMEDGIQAFVSLDEDGDGKLTVEEAGAAGGGHQHGGRGAGARGGAAEQPAASSAGRRGFGQFGGRAQGARGADRPDRPPMEDE